MHNCHRSMHVMHFQKLDLNLLVVFRSLMTYRSVTGAAGALNLTQSAASHALSRLRRFYADPLFVRNGQTMGPTARAFEIDQDVQEALAKIARTFKTEFDPRHLAREFRIALVNFGGLYMVPALLGKLATEAPDVHVHVDHVPPEKAVKRLEQGELDFLIGDLMGRKASIETVHLLTDE